MNTSTPPGESSFTDTKYEFRSTVLGGEKVGMLTVASWNSSQGKGFIVPINGRKWGDEVEWSSPDGQTTFGGNGSQLDTRGADVGLDDPYNTTDGSTGYPTSGGDPTNYSRCAWEGMPISCGQAHKLDEWNHKPMPSHGDPGRPASPTTSPHESGHAPDGSAGSPGNPGSQGPTSKPEGSPVPPGPVEPSSVPNTTGGSITFIMIPGMFDGLDHETDGQGSEPNTSLSGDDDPIPLPTDLRDRLVRRAGAGTSCGDAVQALINRVAKNTKRKAAKRIDIGSLYDRMGEGRIRLDPSLTTPFYGLADEVISLGDKRGFRIGPLTQGDLKARMKEYPKMSQSEAEDRVFEGYVSAALHELIHQSAKNGLYNDTAVARAAYDLLIEKGLKPPLPPSPDNDGANSTYININYLYRFCPSPYSDQATIG